MKYEPKNNNLELEIKDNIFIIDAMKAQTVMDECQKTHRKNADIMANGYLNDTTLKEVISAAKKCVDLLLGKGACDKIFDEKTGYFDVTDLYFFIVRNVNKKIDEKTDEYSGK